MRIVEHIDEWLNVRRSPAWGNATAGFVPTMGALHEGHVSLIERSKQENDRTIVSIFINPTQFNDPKDLENYPRPWTEDCTKLAAHEVDYVLYPTYQELYPDRFRIKVIETEFSPVLCGHSRPGHFDGVLTVVMKLLNLVDADRAYFGEKDYQQYLLVRQMAQALFLKTQIVPCPTIRATDGLALSSRNVHLSESERECAPHFYRLLTSGKPIDWVRSELESLGFKIDYIEDREGRRYGAVFLGNVRLIDNALRKT